MVRVSRFEGAGVAARSLHSTKSLQAGASTCLAELGLGIGGVWSISADCRIQVVEGIGDMSLLRFARMEEGKTLK